MQTQELVFYYSSLLWRKFPVVLLGTVLCSGITFFICFFLPPVYLATALVKVTITTTTTNDDVFGAQASAVDYALLVASPDVLHAIAQDEPGVSSAQLQQSISASPVDNTQIIQVSARASSARQASTLANLAANTFVQVESAKEAERVQNAILLLAPHIAASKNDLDVASRQLRHLQESGATLSQISQQQSIVDADQANYDQLVANMGLLQIQKLQANTTLNVAQSADIPSQPISPHIFQSTVISALLGLCLTTMLILLVDWFDVTIKTADEARRLLQTGSLAVVPYDPHQNLHHLLHSGVAIADKNTVHDAYVVLCAYLLHKGRSWPRCLMITSPDQGSGTTTAAVLLATLMAQSGKNVLLVDANLFRPALHEIFQVPNTRGVVNGLDVFWKGKDRHKQDLSSWLGKWKTFYPNLWLLPTGPAIGRTDALLELVDLLHCLKDAMFDVVSGHNLLDLLIIDAPAFAKDGVMPSLASLADELLLVSVAGRTKKDALLHVTHFFSDLQIPCVATIFNDRKLGKQAWPLTISRSKRPSVSTANDNLNIAPPPPVGWQAVNPVVTDQTAWPVQSSSGEPSWPVETPMQKPHDLQNSQQMVLAEAVAHVSPATNHNLSGLLQPVSTSDLHAISALHESSHLSDSGQEQSTPTTLHVSIAYSDTLRPTRRSRLILAYPSPLAVSLTGVRPEENKRPLLVRTVSSPSLQVQHQPAIDTHPVDQHQVHGMAMELETPSPISLPSIKAGMQDLVHAVENNSQPQHRFQFTSLLREGRASFGHAGVSTYE